MRLIGINGFKTSGKDSAYKAIEQILAQKKARMRAETPYRVKRGAFADKLKIAAAMAIGLDEGLGNEGLIAAMDEAKESWEFTVEGPRKKDRNGWSREIIAEFTGREYLQWFGGNARKVFGDTFWIDQVLPRPEFVMGNMSEEADAHYAEVMFWKTHYPDADVIVVTDVRYENEAHRIKELQGEIWEIIRPGIESDGHSSEIPLPRELVDLTIHNDGTLDDLTRKVDEALCRPVLQ